MGGRGLPKKGFQDFAPPLAKSDIVADELLRQRASPLGMGYSCINIRSCPSVTKQAKVALLTATISAVVAIIVALIQFGPGWIKKSPHDQRQTQSTTIAGRVVDRDSNLPVPGADISIGGKPSGYVTEDNGNFRFSIVDPTSDHRVRVRVDKPGYVSWDRSVGVPSEDLVIQLQRESK